MVDELEFPTEPHSGIRQPAEPAGRGIPSNTITYLKDRSEGRLVTEFNDRWRVIDAPLQWILQVRKGRRSQKASGWRSRSFCSQRTSLLCCIRELCGLIDNDALAIIETLPDRHVDWDRAISIAAKYGTSVNNSGGFQDLHKAVRHGRL